jgi:hypothetical protein
MTDKDSVIEFLRKHAPLAPLGECLQLAEEFKTLYDSEYYLKCIIVILSNRLLCSNGTVREEFKEGRPAWQVALREVQQCNAWVVCGPKHNAMEALLCEFDKKI